MDMNNKSNIQFRSVSSESGIHFARNCEFCVYKKYYAYKLMMIKRVAQRYHPY